MIKVMVMGRKLNVVDSENNLVGFDMEDDCCAHGGYFILPDIKEKHPKKQAGIPVVDFDGYIFDTKFFKEIKIEDGDGGGIVVFKMVSDGEKDYVPDLYLHLFNCHNGYYSKGFKTSFGEIREGTV